MSDVITTGREAIRRNDWDEALRSLTAVDAERGLDPDDLMLLGDAYWWTGQPDAAIATFERAYRGYLQAGQRSEAALAGSLLSYYAMRRMATSVAAGWISRVERLVSDDPEAVGHAWLALLDLAKTLLQDRDFDLALEKADAVIELGQRMQTPGVQALAMSFKGFALIQSGQIQPGTALVDEATVVAMSEGGDLRTACDVYCNTIAACSTIGDYPRAQQWTDEAERWMQSHALSGYTGVCRVHRAELKRLHGSWPEAVQVAREACDELERFRLLDGVGFAHYEIGETRRRMGDLQAAEESFQLAYQYGSSAQPGWALLLLNKGEVEEAAKSIAAAVGRQKGSQPGTSPLLATGRLLPAQVEIALAAGDEETAHRAIEALEETAAQVEGRWWQASALSCRGSFELHGGDNETAVRVLDRAWRMWQEIDLPYESALARAGLGRAKVALGDDMAGRLDLQAAERTFRELGATADLRRVAEMLGGTAGLDRGERVTRVFMFTDIVTSTDLIGLIGDDAWEDLLEWHDRTLRDSFRKHDGEVVRHTGDGFFVSFESASAGVDCAVDVQKRLLSHRREHGFAPWVRIGLHVAEATRLENDFAGHGVHAAARIGALGSQEEIVISQEVVEAIGELSYPLSQTREVSLKGIAEPVVVHDLEWR